MQKQKRLKSQRKVHNVFTFSWIVIVLLIALSSILFLGFRPLQIPPPGAKLTELQEQHLRRDGAQEFASDDYMHYLRAYSDAKEKLIKENARLKWFRNYASVENSFQQIYEEGKRIAAIVHKIKKERSQRIENQISLLREKVDSFRKTTEAINEKRLSGRSLTKAELLLKDAEFLNRKEDFDAAQVKLERVNSYIKQAVNAVHPILTRYNDKNQLAKWRGLVEDTLRESRDKGINVFIVSKIDKSLTIYKKGMKAASFKVGLGRNGLTDKLYSGDNATPEGRYHVARKHPESKFYKALLLDYPNKEDRQRFMQARKKGLIPGTVGIGALLEIHGGGKDGMTRGCISLDNDDMDKIYEIAHEGTPVTIVGTLHGNGQIFADLKRK